MKIHSTVLNICLIISTGCLGAGYILAGYWLILPVLLSIVFFWIITRNRSVFWSASGLLLAYVLLAAFGLTAGLSSTLMIVACTAALVSWDLILFNQSMVTNSLARSIVALEKTHLLSLAVAASAGLMLALLSSNINLHFSFVIIILLVLTTIGGLIFGMQYIMKKKH